MAEKKQYDPYAFVDKLANQIEEKSKELAGKYTVNEQNMDNFKKLCYFFHWLTGDSGGEVNLIDIEPSSEHAIVCAEVPLVELRGDGLKRFIDILQYVDLLSTATTGPETIMIKAGVSRVWEAVG